MRAYKLVTNSLDGLELGDHSPPGLGDFDVCVAVRANSLNYRDLMVLNGVIGKANVPGLVPLSDGAGEVRAVGSGVTRFRPGDRVAACFYPGWTTGPRPAGPLPALGGELDGLLAEEITAPEQTLVSIPAHLSFEEAATLPCAGVTAWSALVRMGAPLPGETVVVRGTGGVSIFALQFAKLAGASVLATTSSPGKVGMLRNLGADEVVVAAQESDWADQVRGLTGGYGADQVIETLGDFQQAALAVRNGGRIAAVGRRSGPPRGGIDALIAREVRAIGIGVGSRADFEAMNRAIAVSGLKPVIGQSFAFADAPAAYRAMSTAADVGKIVIAH